VQHNAVFSFYLFSGVRSERSQPSMLAPVANHKIIDVFLRNKTKKKIDRFLWLLLPVNAFFSLQFCSQCIVQNERHKHKYNGYLF
jgi:hypothetical protein